MKFRAYSIKSWIMLEISPMGWASLITRAMPELMEHNHKFSAYYVSERTSWTEMEVDIINWHLRKMYEKELPTEVLTENVFLRIDLLEKIHNTFLTIRKSFERIVYLIFNKSL